MMKCLPFHMKNRDLTHLLTSTSTLKSVAHSVGENVNFSCGMLIFDVMIMTYINLSCEDEDAHVCAQAWEWRQHTSAASSILILSW